MEGKLNKQINKSKKVSKIKQDLEISGYQSVTEILQHYKQFLIFTSRFQTGGYQKVSKKVLFKGPKFQTKNPSCQEDLVYRDRQKYTIPLRRKDLGTLRIKRTQYQAQRNLVLVVIVVVMSYLVHYNTLLQNATDPIINCDSFFITKFDSY